MIHCSQQPGFLHEGLPLVDAVFRVLIANGNRPMSVTEITERLNKPPHEARTLLRTLGRRRSYLGIRPVEG